MTTYTHRNEGTKTLEHVFKGTARKLLWSSTTSRTRLTTMLQENTSSGHVATRTHRCLSHPKNSNNINCCLNGISRIYFKSLEKKI